DASLQRSVDEIRNTAQMLSEQFAAEPALRLTDAQRDRIQQRPEPVSHGRMVFRARALWLAGGLAAAACLSLAIIVPARNRHNARDTVAMNGGAAGQSPLEKKRPDGPGFDGRLLDKTHAPESESALTLQSNVERAATDSKDFQNANQKLE